MPTMELIPTDCELRCVEMDFATKIDREIPSRDVAAAIAGGKFVWVDVRMHGFEGARQTLKDLGVPPEIVERAQNDGAATQLMRFESCLHLALTACRLRDDATLDLERVDVIIFENLLATVHRGRPDFLEAVRAAYRSDFQRHARSPSFLLYELWDHLLDSYHEVQQRFEDRVEQVQAELVGDVDDDVFRRVSSLGSSLLHFRKVLSPSRAVLGDLATRRSVFVSEATQPYLGNMIGTVERVLQDLLVDRDILGESMNLYMSMVSHKTNRVMNKLTVFSIIFLPLTFLCGIYGMNFEVLPELHWRHGYLFFWLAVALIVSTALVILRRLKLL
jgi:magnesium transporter